MTDHGDPVKKGDVLAGKYTVDNVLGRGGMGVVVAATHRDLDQRVALKFMLPAALADANASQRFLREARAAVRLRSEHVARVLDVGELENGAPYIVMEYLEGSNLAQLIEQRGALPIPEAVSYVLHSCVGVAEAHQCGIVHRDLKPENLFVTRRADGSPLVKVLDFGISKILSGADAATSATVTGTTMGSPAYMAPEQMKSAKHVDERADIWSLGAILYHTCSGQLPFSGSTIPEIFAAVLTEPHRPFLEVMPSAHPNLAAAIDCCLQKDPTERFQSVAALSQAIEDHADAQGKHAASFIRNMILGNVGTTPGGGDGDPEELGQRPVQTTLSAAHGQREARAGTSRRVIPVVLGLAIVAAVAFTLSRTGDKDPAPIDGTHSLEPAGEDRTIGSPVEKPPPQAALTDAAQPSVPPDKVKTSADPDAGTTQSKTPDAATKRKPRRREKRRKPGAFDTFN